VTRLLAGAVAALAACTSCGYGVTGKADLLPKSIGTIAIPAWGNQTERYKVGDRLAAALTREFITRTRYAIVSDPNQAEAVLTGSVLQVMPQPTVTGRVEGRAERAAGVQIMVVMQMRLTERATGKILFDRPRFEARQRYEISIDAAAYFEESASALDRLARDVARDAVSAILEGF
jgi:Lipopolysaccharide-assembly